MWLPIIAFLSAARQHHIGKTSPPLGGQDDAGATPEVNSMRSLSAAGGLQGVHQVLVIEAISSPPPSPRCTHWSGASPMRFWW